MNNLFFEFIFEAFYGLPMWVQIFYWIVLAIVITTFISAFGLWALSYGARANKRRMRKRAKAEGKSEADFLWVFVVPALNEEVTIRDAVTRLQGTAATNAMILVVDDGSDDRTGEILSTFDDPRLHVLRRELPHARTGKAAALNNAYQYLVNDVLHRPGMEQWAEDNTILCIVDADGRLAYHAPVHVAPHFHNRQTGGVQSLVHIYNQRSPLTWAQDVEFASFGRVFQIGRTWWGTANMGGNGQFNRLSALTTVADEEGPWRHRLTEDQDLGVRLLQAGWRGEQESRAVISQQGLNSLPKLYKQRVRWAQGAWQCIPLIRGVGKMNTSFLGKLDASYYLLLPLLQLINGLGFVLSIILAIFTSASFATHSVWILVFFLGLGFGPGLIVQISQSKKWYWILPNIILVIPYTLYSWLIFPVITVALFRHLRGNTSWKKTGRETTDGRIVGETESKPLSA
ncbi:glycosyltransferase family 2 protein [Leucobacter sp. cx-328]|uniref:glycosyltransferase family 2 protein n=1 Tax=unclassified Leucobacter TaxID=2621730 RepID=UPI00165DBFF8|nr:MULTISPECIES: glycosyltransferase family 2 protein [unclassified Leucobacter]MBC9942932.1 glycosyltransferase family 2 protein [Leucobacter sp. cx-328]